MRIAVIMVGRTVPGFSGLLDAVGRTFRVPVSMQMIDFPLTRSFRSSRGQYDAEAFLKEVVRLTPQGERSVYIIREDMFSPPLDFVFGLSRESSCIVSTARLDPRFYGTVQDLPAAGRLFGERLVKEVIHELGHSFGLPHCSDKSCVMVFSEFVDGVDAKGAEFCRSCRKALKLEKAD